MECFCKFRDLYKALDDFEERFFKEFDLKIKEALVLSSLSGECASARDIAEFSKMKLPQTSKIIKSVELKGLIERHIQENDKRYMDFVLTSKGEALVKKIKCNNVEIPEILKLVMHEKK